jgi:nucleobase:cation symporter-1, NCS1 family
VALLIATLTTNLAANVVSPANDFANAAPRLIDFKKGALITAVLGIAIFPWKLYNDAGAYLFTWLLGYGAMLGSVGGVMIADYFVLRKKELVVEDLYRRGGQYEYAGGINWLAMISLAVGIGLNVPGFLGAITSLDGQADIQPGVFFTTVYEYAWFVAFFVSGGLYLLLMKAFNKVPR